MTKRYGGELIFCERDEWGLVEVVETASSRSLHFGSPVEQSCLYFHAPFTLAHEYQAQLLDLILEADFPIHQLLMLGLGGGSLMSQLLPCLPDTQCTAVELRQTVIEVAHDFFQLPHSPQLHCLAEDAALFVAKDRQQYDVIVMDLYDENGLPPDFTTDTFHQLLFERLNTPSMLLINLWQTTPRLTQPILNFWQQQAKKHPNLELHTHPIHSSQNLILQLLLK